MGFEIWVPKVLVSSRNKISTPLRIQSSSRLICKHNNHFMGVNTILVAPKYQRMLYRFWIIFESNINMDYMYRAKWSLVLQSTPTCSPLSALILPFSELPKLNNRDRNDSGPIFETQKKSISWNAFVSRYMICINWRKF